MTDNSHLYEVYRENAWRHFTVHADQRLKMFQFYITVSTALLAGGLLFLRTNSNDLAVGFLGFLATFFSFVFWKLEDRTRTLVKNAEDAIKHLDESVDLPDLNNEPSPLKLFTRDDFRNAHSSSLTRFSYHRCFVCVFVVIGCLGVLGVGYGFADFLPSASAGESGVEAAPRTPN